MDNTSTTDTRRVARVYWHLECQEKGCARNIVDTVSRHHAEAFAIKLGWQQGPRGGWWCKEHAEEQSKCS